MTMTYKSDPDIQKTYPYTKNGVCRSRLSKVRTQKNRTDIQINRHSTECIFTAAFVTDNAGVMGHYLPPHSSTWIISRTTHPSQLHWLSVLSQLSHISVHTVVHNCVTQYGTEQLFTLIIQTIIIAKILFNGGRKGVSVGGDGAP